MTTVLESLNKALHLALAQDERVYLLGQDILDPYGGAFKVTRGLSQAFPDRVIATPISEAGMVGIGVGMALRGLHPVVEIMFGDFLTLAADQLINHAAKFPWMYNGGKKHDEKVIVPLVVRTPMGGGRGYGPTHSQSLEKLFLGIPGLSILAPSAYGNPGTLFLNAIRANDPILFIEHKLLYSQILLEVDRLKEFELDEINPSPAFPEGLGPTYILRLRDSPPADISLTAYGYMAELARQAIERLAYEQEIFCELIVPTQLAPFNPQPIIGSVRKTSRLLTIEEGTYSLGWGAEIVASASVALGPVLKASRRLASLDTPIPASTPLEAAVLPSIEQIVDACKRIFAGVT